MKGYIISLFTLLIFIVLYLNRMDAQPVIGTYPPQIHQQICQESTFTRYLNVFNEGDALLTFTAAWSPAPVGWAMASPMSGQIEPGDTTLIQFDFNSAGLPIENYLIDFVISSNDPADPEHTVLCMLHVQDLHIILTPDEDSICMGCTTKLNTSVFGCSEAYYFSWISDPPGFTSTEKSPVVSPYENTIYIVTVTDGGYSKQDSVGIIVNGATGLMVIHQLSGISVYPNPGNDVLKVKFNSDITGQGFIVISDLSGRMLQSEDVFLENGPNELSFRTGSLIPGVYLLSVKTEKTLQQVSKIVIN